MGSSSLKMSKSLLPVTGRSEKWFNHDHQITGTLKRLLVCLTSSDIQSHLTGSLPSIGCSMCSTETNKM